MESCVDVVGVKLSNSLISSSANRVRENKILFIKFLRDILPEFPDENNINRMLGLREGKEIVEAYIDCLDANNNINEETRRMILREIRSKVMCYILQL